MTKTAIETKDAPKAIGPYSQGVTANGFLFVSGQLPIDPVLGTIPEGSIAKRAHIVFNNLNAIAREAGTQLDNTVKTTLFLTDMNDFTTVNDVYNTYFKKPFPARSTVQVAALPLGADIEMEAIFTLF